MEIQLIELTKITVQICTNLYGSFQEIFKQ